MIEVKKSKSYNIYGEFKLSVKIEQPSVQEVMKLQGIINRAYGEILVVMEANPTIKKNAGQWYTLEHQDNED